MIVTYSSLMCQISSDEWQKPMHLLTVSIYDYCFLSWVSDGRHLGVFFCNQISRQWFEIIVFLGALLA